MTKQEQIQYIIDTPAGEIDSSLLTENFTKEEFQGILIKKFYNGEQWEVIEELADSINGIYNSLATTIPPQNLMHLEETRRRYMDIKFLKTLIVK